MRLLVLSLLIASCGNMDSNQSQLASKPDYCRVSIGNILTQGNSVSSSNRKGKRLIRESLMKRGYVIDSRSPYTLATYINGIETIVPVLGKRCNLNMVLVSPDSVVSSVYSKDVSLFRGCIQRSVIDDGVRRLPNCRR